MPVDREAFDPDETRALHSLYSLTGRFGDVSGLGPHPESEGVEAQEAFQIFAETPPTSPARAARRLDAIARYRHASARDAGLVSLDQDLIVQSLNGLSTTDGQPQTLAEILETHLEEVPVERYIAVVAANAVEQEAIPEWLATVSTALCQGQLVDAVLPGGDSEKVARLTTCFCVPDNVAPDLEAFKKLIDPLEWPKCSGFWCGVARQGDEEVEQDPFGGTTRTMRVVETVGVCGDGGGAWTIDVCLDVVISEVPGSDTRPKKLTMTYDLCRDGEGNVEHNDWVDVDRGVIEVTFENGEVCVKSTKDIHFTGLWEGQSTVDSACATGYGDAAIDMVFGCADQLPPDDTAIRLCEQTTGGPNG